MKKVPIAEVEPGQVVARSVAASSGMVMVQPGAVLTAEMISRLLDLGVDTIWLEGIASDAKSVEVVLQELEQRFAGHQHDPLMMELEAVVARCIRQKATAGRD